MAKKYIVKLNKIIGADGKPCANPLITFEKPTCANIICEVVTNRDGTRHIKIQVPDDCPDGCVYAKIECQEGCDNCGQQRIRICPCTKDSECPDCHECGPMGYCISKCLEGEFCSGDKCVECDEFNPCTGGKVCENGKCKCPPSKPYQNQKGECVECNASTPLAPCQDCIDGKIVAKTCPEGVMNPDTCICVQCVKDSDCVKPNEKCGPNGCECIDGFRRNPMTGDCEPETDCTRDIDCGDCRRCLENGKCGDYICPTGYAPSKIPGECCVKLCDCNNPSCPPGHKCINLDGTLCYCQNCNVKCSNGKCPEGCNCNKNGDCEPNPCGGKCDPNTPCPPNCGCDENGDCVPCKNLDCDQCEKTPNCNCNTPDNCEPSPCAGPCDENHPCPNKNCGCTKERQCIDCRKVSCQTDKDCPDGCDCQDDKKCGKTPCLEVNCENDLDCGKDCVCDKTNGKCKRGTPNPDNSCKDKSKIEDNGNCTIKATYETEDCCECRDVYVHANVSTTANDRTVQSILRIGNLPSSTALSATGIAGDASISGQIRYTFDQVLKEINSGGHVLPGGLIVNITNSIVTDFVNSDVSSITGAIKPNGAVVNVAGVNYKIVETTMYAESIGIITNDINLCTYRLGKTLLYRKTAAEAGNYPVFLDKVQRCKTPIFTWYKSTDGISYTQLLKRYSTKTGNTYTDILKESDGLEICKFYKYSSDCGCAKDAVYSCSGGAATKYVPYIPEDLDITQLDACGLSIEIAEQTICSLFKPSSLPWKLYINGVFEQNVNVDASNKIFPGNLTITKTVPIKEVKLEYPCDDCNRPLIILLPTLGSDCFTCSDASLSMVLAGNCATGIQVNGSMFRISNPLIPVTGCALKIYLNGNHVLSAITDAGGLYLGNIPVPNGNGTYTVKVVNCFGCEVSNTIVISDCCQATINGLQYNCATQIITSTLSGCGAPGNFTVKQGINVLHTAAYSNSILMPFTLANGNYTFSVDCGAGCTPEVEFSVACGIPDFDLTAGCQGLQGIITASNYTGGSGAPYLLEYSINNFSSILGAGASDPLTWFSTPGVEYQARLKDSANNLSVVKDTIGVDCSVNSFSFRAFLGCIFGVPHFCFEPSKTGVYSITVVDFNSVTVFSGTVSGVAGQYECYPYSTPPALGLATTTVVHNGNTVVQTYNITTCPTATITYNCATGLSVTGVSTFNVHSPGYPPNGYGPFSSSDTNLFFTDGVTSSRILTIKSPDGSETYGTVTTNCCTHDAQIVDDVCAGSSAKAKLILTGIAGTYELNVFNGLTPVCLAQSITHAGGTVTYPITCNLTSSQTYTFEVKNVTYGGKLYKDQLIGNVTCSVSVNYTATNCGVTGGDPGCPVTAADIVIAGGCNPTITNNSVYPINALFRSTENTNCTGASFAEGAQVSINPGQTVSYGPLAHVNLGKKLVVTYVPPGTDGCVLEICYTGCTGVSSCNLTADPVPSCDNVGANPANDRLGVTNSNSNDVLCFIDGVFRGFIPSGGIIYAYYPHNSTHTILFKCADDISQTRTITYLLNC